MSDTKVRILKISTDNRSIVEGLDKTKYLKLDKSTPRLKQFLFAMALGYETKLPTELNKKDTFVRDEYIGLQEEALLFALYIDSIKDGDLSTITDTNRVYDLCEKYANTGYKAIEDLMSKQTETLTLYSLIEEMDNSYNEFFENEDGSIK